MHFTLFCGPRSSWMCQKALGSIAVTVECMSTSDGERLSTPSLKQPTCCYQVIDGDMDRGTCQRNSVSECVWSRRQLDGFGSSKRLAPQRRLDDLLR